MHTLCPYIIGNLDHIQFKSTHYLFQIAFHKTIKM